MELRSSLIAPGKHKLTDAEYHADAAISSTQLVEACRSPAHFWAISTLNPDSQRREDTDDLILGRAIHTFLLEPKEFPALYVVLPEDAPRRPSKTQLTAKKQSPATQETICWWEEFDASLAERGAQLITADQRRTIGLMAGALAHQQLETETGRVYTLADIFKSGEAEQAYFWKDPVTGLPCRCKADWVVGNIVIDFKSTRDAQIHQFRRQVGGLRYHMRAAFYLDGITAVTGKAPSRFILLAQEKTAPFCAAPYQLLDSDIEQGRTEYRRALGSIAASIQKGRFDGYSRKVQELSIPDYLYDQ